MTIDEILSDLYLQIHTVDDARDIVDEIMWREINAHVAAEREACAKVCDELVSPSRSHRDPGKAWITGTLDCAAAIRARGDA